MINKLKPTEYLVVAGGAIVLIFGLLKWFSWKIKTADGVITSSSKSNAFDYLLTGVVPWLLVIGAALATILLSTGALNRGKVPWPLAILAATVLAAVLVIVRVIIGYDPDLENNATADVSRGIGLWFTALGSIIAAVGAFLTYQANSFDSRTSNPGAAPRPDREIPPTTS